MRRETIWLTAGLVFGAMGVGCGTQEPSSPVLLPTATPTVAPVSETQEIVLTTLTPEPAPSAVSTFPRESSVFFSPGQDSPPRRREIAPGEIIPRVRPNDIFGLKTATEPTRFLDGTEVAPGTQVAVILSPHHEPVYLPPEAWRIYFDRGAIRRHWFSADGRRQYVVSADGKRVVGGPIAQTESTYMTIRRYDRGMVGKFIGFPAVNADGYIAVIVNENELDAGEEEPHHGGKVFEMPPGWKILKIAFGTGDRRGDLLAVTVNERGKIGLNWLVKFIPSFPSDVLAACAESWRHELNDCKMKYIRDERGKQRPADQKIELISVPDSQGIYFADVIWNPYP